MFQALAEAYGVDEDELAWTFQQWENDPGAFLDYWLDKLNDPVMAHALTVDAFTGVYTPDELDTML